MPENDNETLDANDIATLKDNLRKHAFSVFVGLDAIANYDWDNIQHNNIDVKTFWAQHAAPSPAREAALDAIVQILSVANEARNPTQIRIDWDKVYDSLKAIRVQGDALQAAIDAHSPLFFITGDGEDAYFTWTSHIDDTSRTTAEKWLTIRNCMRAIQGYEDDSHMLDVLQNPMELTFSQGTGSGGSGSINTGRATTGTA